MNRRETLKKLMVASGSLVALPAWAEKWTIDDFNFQTIFSEGEQETLSAVADTIIPASGDPGALTVGVDKFLQKLIKDCYEQEVQENIKAQLNVLESNAKTRHGISFNECDQAKREEIFVGMATSQNEAENNFFNIMKGETIRGFRTSELVMTKYLDYVVVPGHYYGCIDVKA